MAQMLSHAIEIINSKEFKFLIFQSGVFFFFLFPICSTVIAGLHEGNYINKRPEAAIPRCFIYSVSEYGDSAVSACNRGAPTTQWKFKKGSIYHFPRNSLINHSYPFFAFRIATAKT